MARLSGMPSEHDQEGPGDAPGHQSSRPNKTQSQEAASSSKRTASPLHLSQTKRAKHVQDDDNDDDNDDDDDDDDDDDEDEIVLEMQQSFSRSQHGDTSDTPASATSRRHSEHPAATVGFLSEDDGQEDELAFSLPAQPPSGLTPHLDRLGAVKPGSADIRRVRHSLPAQLGVERVDDEIDNTQFQYAPLTAVLDGRTRRRLRRSHLSQEVNSYEDHQKKDKKRLLELSKQLKAQAAKIQDLEYRLEASRLDNIDISMPELAQELADAREELNALRASSAYNGSDRDDSGEPSTFDGPADLSDDEDQRMLLVDPDELDLSRHIDMGATPTGKYSSRVQQLSSQMTFGSLSEVSQLVQDSLLDEDTAVISDKIEDQAVKRYEREIQHYSRRIAASQGALRIVTLELQNLSFLGPGSSSKDIIVELRHSFDKIRQEIDTFFPNIVPGLTNQQVLHKIPELFRGMFFELKEKMDLLSSSRKTELLLRRQYEGVLDILADSEDCVKELEQKKYSLLQSNEQKQRNIFDLEEHISTLTEQTQGQAIELTNKTTYMIRLQDEVRDLDHTLGRLETEHKETIARMEDEHEARDVAENDARQKGDYIEHVERRIEGTENEVENLTNELAQLVQRLNEQTRAREAAEGQRDEQAELAKVYANTIEGLNETIADLRARINESEEDVAIERAQREKTEAELEEVNEKVEDLNERIHNAGIQGNELRAKLFQLQQEKEQEIQNLETHAQGRVDTLSEYLCAELEARKVAEKTVAKLGDKIEGLEADLATLKIDLTNMTEARQLLEQDREQQVAILNQQLVNLKAKYTPLETYTNSTIDALRANITDLNNRVEEQQIEIKHLNQVIAEKDNLYEHDTTLLKGQIIKLENDLARERADNDRNEEEINSLSQRVDDEARELMSMMISHSEESKALHTIISNLDATIENHQADAAQSAIVHEETVTGLEREIEELQDLGNARVETISALQSQIEDLKKCFAKQEEDTRITIDTLNHSHRRLLEENEGLSLALKHRNALALKAVQGMKAAHVVVKPPGTDLHKVQTGKVVKTTEKVKVGKKGTKKRMTAINWRDSGMFEEQDDTDETQVDSSETDEQFLAA